MSKTEIRGQLCIPHEDIALDRASVIAEVYGQTIRAEDENLVACYFLAHDLTPDDAMLAMNFFSENSSLLVDAQTLVDDCGAAAPSTVVIRCSEFTGDLLGWSFKEGVLFELPDNAINKSGWELFWHQQSLMAQNEIDDMEEFPKFDSRSLRRKVYAIRASIEDDRSPWLQKEMDALKDLTAGEPDGCERFVAMVEDMKYAMDNGYDFENLYSVVIPTSIQRPRAMGALTDWVHQVGREIVVAHGLDAVQVAHCFELVKRDPSRFVDAGQLLSGNKGRENILDPMILPDSRLNWMTTDFEGRRNAREYEKMRSTLNASLHPQQPAVEMPLDSAGR